MFTFSFCYLIKREKQKSQKNFELLNCTYQQLGDWLLMLSYSFIFFSLDFPTVALHEFEALLYLTLGPSAVNKLFLFSSTSLPVRGGCVSVCIS